MKIVSARAPMSAKARDVLRDPARARKVFEAVIETRSTPGKSRAYSLFGLNFKSALAPRKPSKDR